MSGLSVSKSWSIFLRALKQEGWWKLEVAAEWMYRLNVFARSVGRHVVADQIYDLKNDFIQYLYQHGYCYEVKLHVQKSECWSCDGTGEYWATTEECRKCNGTGVYRRTELYAFRFEIHGKRYAWHQLKRLVDYPVKLTEGSPGVFIEPARDAAILTLSDAWLGCCVIWWCLLVHGVIGKLILLQGTWGMWMAKLGIDRAVRVYRYKLIDFRYWWKYQAPWHKPLHAEDDYSVDDGDDDWDDDADELIDAGISNSYEDQIEDQIVVDELEIAQHVVDLLKPGRPESQG